MRIESILRRKGGTKVTLDGVEYHFKPDPDGREFADVTNEEHIGVFLSIREGYRLAGSKTQAEPPPAVKPAATVKPAPVDAPAPPSQAEGPLPGSLEKLDRHELADLYKKHFGHAPPPRLKPEKILRALYDGKAGQ